MEPSASVLGSISASIYARSLGEQVLAGLPAEVAEAARESVGGALLAAAELGRQAPAVSSRLMQAAEVAFLRSLQAACLIAGFVALAGGAFAAGVLPARPSPSRAGAPKPGSALEESAALR